MASAIYVWLVSLRKFCGEGQDNLKFVKSAAAHVRQNIIRGAWYGSHNECEILKLYHSQSDYLSSLRLVAILCDHQGLML